MNLFRIIYEMSDIILQQLVSLSSFAVWTKNCWEHLSYHLILVSLGYNQLVKSEILRSKENNWKPLVFTNKHNTLAHCNKGNGNKRNFLSKYGFQILSHQILTIALFLVSSFFNGSIYLMENMNPIYFFKFLTHNLLI